MTNPVNTSTMAIGITIALLSSESPSDPSLFGSSDSPTLTVYVVIAIYVYNIYSYSYT